MDIEKNYALFKHYLTSYVSRDGINGLIDWLDSTDFKTAPASTKYNLCEEGGLCKHSLDVFGRLIKLLQMEFPDEIVEEEIDVEDEETHEIVKKVVQSRKYACPIPKESVAIVSLLHDVSKANFYMTSSKNVKDDETGKWESVRYYTVRDDSNRLIYGSNSQNSVYILSQFLKLTYDESLSILYSMGCMDAFEDKCIKNVINAYSKSILALLLNEAHMLATFVDEVENG